MINFTGVPKVTQIYQWLYMENLYSIKTDIPYQNWKIQIVTIAAINNVSIYPTFPIFLYNTGKYFIANYKNLLLFLC